MYIYGNERTDSMAQSDRSKANWDMARKAMKQIHAKLGTEENCKQTVLEAIATRKTIFCARQNCGQKNKIPSPVVRMFPCDKCRKNISITAETYFHGVQKFKPRLIIFELHELGITLSANQLSKILAITTDTVNRALKGLSILAANGIEEAATVIPSLLCSNAVGRRTNQTAANEPPSFEEIALQRKMQAETASQSSRTNLNDHEETVLNLVSDKGKTFDQLFGESGMTISKLSGSLFTLELKGYVERKFPDLFALAKPETLTVMMFESEEANLQKVIAQRLTYFVKDFFQSIGRKNLQLYAVLEWISKDRKRWHLGSLLELCASSRQIHYEEILNYQTPLTFFVFSQKNTS